MLSPGQGGTAGPSLPRTWEGMLSTGQGGTVGSSLPFTWEGRHSTHSWEGIGSEWKSAILTSCEDIERQACGLCVCRGGGGVGDKALSLDA